MPFMNAANPAARKSLPHAYRTFLDSIRRAGNWFPKPRALVRAIGSRHSDLLMHLINVGQAKPDEAGWILATPRFIEDGLGITPDKQEPLLTRLEEKGIIELNAAGTPRQRIRVDLDRVRELTGGKL
jgi:hypothetical protein